LFPIYSDLTRSFDNLATTKTQECCVKKFLSDKSGFSAIAYALIAAFAMTAVIGSLGLLLMSIGTGQIRFPSLSGFLGIY